MRRHLEFIDDKRDSDKVIKSLRNQDSHAEDELSLFMDKYLYARLPGKENYCSIKRVKDKKLQIQGIDVTIVTIDGKPICIDEKAQIYYLNKNLPTFAFEVLSLSRQGDRIGWLCDTALQTDFYLLIWPFGTAKTVASITFDQFTKADCLLISRKKLLNYLNELGLQPERLLTDARSIRTNRLSGKIDIPDIPGIYYYCSNNLAEAPINLIINRSILEELMSAHLIVTPQKVLTNRVNPLNLGEVR